MHHRTTEKIDNIISLARDLLPQNCAPPAPHAHTSASPLSYGGPTPPQTPSRRTEAPPSTPLPSAPLLQSPLKQRSSPAATSPPDSSPPASPTKQQRAASPSPSLTKPVHHSSPSPFASPSPSPSPRSSPTDSCPNYRFSELEDRSRPSDYLHARCPACFGGKWEDPEMILAVIMSGDACFTQMRNKDKGWADPPHRHPTTVFVPEEVTKKMDSFVDSVRPPPKLARNPRKVAQVVEEDEEDEDHIEDPEMPVPKSVLDDCQASFSAADEKRMKSSTQFFHDMGLMGLNCRHDHLLFLVNMKTAGEKQ
ncbi:hypothetical protein B0H13DRAFT_1875523 [Mycena leptocephala]|nr:hypothetical protein B0H13DRAFT_1875523 [Mycena leptocephala]